MVSLPFMYVMKIILKVFKHLVEIDTLQQEHFLSVSFFVVCSTITQD